MAALLCVSEAPDTHAIQAGSLRHLPLGQNSFAVEADYKV
jgi:hypothetical protein